MAKKPMPPFMKTAAPTPKSAAAMGKQPAAKKAPGVKGAKFAKGADPKAARNARLSKAQL